MPTQPFGTAFEREAFQDDAFQIYNPVDDAPNDENMLDGRPPIESAPARRRRPRPPMERIYPIDDEWVLALLLASPA